MRKRRRCAIWALTGFILTLTACSKAGGFDPGRAEKGLFSWKTSILSKEQDTLFKALEGQGIHAVYQYFDEETDPEALSSFLKKAEKQNIDVYLLTGSPEWALEESGASLKEEVTRASEINRTLPGSAALEGIVFDIEPYLLEQWDGDGKRGVMDRFTLAMRTAYQDAGEHGLKVILCIPYFYDTEGLSFQLEALISSCCDSAAVMNYYRDREAEHLAVEAALAKKYEKELINIYELQKPGKYGLTDRNTYYGEGLDAVADSFQTLMDTFPDQKLSMALHDYTALREILDDE